ncbi:hypothetical protein N0V90_010697 [Kalmusia sp. IMI 367209]|nr:hypothetical protein N0V90_010697 [Kalmusia sp. IMI 367209]
MAPTYLITAASGHIGQRLVPLLLSSSSKPTLVLPTTNAARLTSALPSDADKSRLHVVEGNIQDPRFVSEILEEHKVTGVFLCLTGDNELFTTFNLFDSLSRSGTVKHLVYLSAAGDYSLESQRNGMLQAVGAAHVAVKFLVEAKIRYGLRPREEEGGFSWTILGPTLFFDNDLRVKREVLVDGVFGDPLGSKGVSRVCENDIALAVAKSLEDDGKQWGGRKICLGSLKMYTNQDVARLWSDALGKEIKPTLSGKTEMDAFEKNFTKKAGPAWGRDIRLMLETFEAAPFGMTEAEYKDQVSLLGKEPESYEKFVGAAAKQWKEQQ